MASDNQQDKSEKATPHKLNEAKKKGQVAKSTELSAVLGFLVFILFWLVLSEWLFVRVGGLFNSAFYFMGAAAGSQQSLLDWSENFFVELLSAVFPLLALLLLIGVVISLFQTGVIFSTHPLKPDLNRVNPVAGVKRLFTLKVLFELFKAICKLFAVSALLYFFALDWFDEALTLRNLSYKKYGGELNQQLIIVALMLGLLLLFLALIDYCFVKWSFAKQMRMSKKDIQDEHKKREGDPELRNKRKKKQVELSKKLSSLVNVQQADVIITNPTHVAVAVKYEPGKMLAPVVLSLGKGEFAGKIRREAKRYDIQIVRSPKLARELYKSCGVGDPIPTELFSRVAVIYRQIYKKNGLKFQRNEL